MCNCDRSCQIFLPFHKTCTNLCSHSVFGMTHFVAVYPIQHAIKILKFTHLKDEKQYFNVILFCISLIIRENEHILRYLRSYAFFPPVNSSFITFVHFSTGYLHFLFVSPFQAFYKLGVYTLCVIIYKYFHLCFFFSLQSLLSIRLWGIFVCFYGHIYWTCPSHGFQLPRHCGKKKNKPSLLLDYEGIPLCFHQSVYGFIFHICYSFGILAGI